MNLEPSNKYLKDFMTNLNFKNLIKNKTCFKSSQGSSIDLILTNQPNLFKNTSSEETGISDCHHLIYTMFRSTIYRLPPKIIKYRDFKNFNLGHFLYIFNNFMNSNLYLSDFSSYLAILNYLLDIFAPFKTKVFRGNNKSFIDAEVRNELFKRARLKNRANKTGNLSDLKEFKAQRNFTVNLIRRKNKKT